MGIIDFLLGEGPGLFESFPHAMKGRGHYGEYLTEYALNNGGLPGRFQTYANVLVPRTGRATDESEIDVLMLHEKGVFVLESKNYSGWIFGSANDRQWTMSLNSRTKERFYNPILQNRGHVRALAEYLGLPDRAFMSFIVFSERCELKKVPDDTEAFHICRRHHLARDLKQALAARDVVFEGPAFDAVKAKLDALKAASTQEAFNAHVANAQQVASGRVCPYCGKELVERHRKSDGAPFIGCSGFPACRYTRSEW